MTSPRQFERRGFRMAESCHIWVDVEQWWWRNGYAPLMCLRCGKNAVFRTQGTACPGVPEMNPCDWCSGFKHTESKPTCECAHAWGAHARTEHEHRCNDCGAC